MSDESVGFRLRGRVQGVGFRWWTSRLARELGLAGTVRNLPDGSVEVFARGDPETLREFRRRLEEGPRSAAVRSIEPIEPPARLPDGFEILR